MDIGLLTAEIWLPGCASLKEKRHRLSGLKHRLGREPNLAVCESGCHDEHQRAVWSFVAIANSKKIVDSMLNRLEDRIENEIDAELAASHREYL